jgi:mRNA interferase YafQ
VSLSHSGRCDMRALKNTMQLLTANDDPLPPEYKVHELSGDWANHRECHVGEDSLLICRADDKEVVFVRAGTHSELI